MNTYTYTQSDRKPLKGWKTVDGNRCGHCETGKSDEYMRDNCPYCLGTGIAHWLPKFQGSPEAVDATCSSPVMDREELKRSIQAAGKISDWPERIYLQRAEDEAISYREASLEDTCWCDTQVFEVDVPYVRADVALAQLEAKEAENESLRKQLENFASALGERDGELYVLRKQQEQPTNG